MESKKNRALRLLKNNKFIICPVCGELLNADDGISLKCLNNHNFDISKKGTVNFAGTGNEKIYDDSLFQNRRKIIDKGIYDPLIDYLTETISEIRIADKEQISILDAGCGEGSFLNRIYTNLNKKREMGICVGLDLSKSGVGLATDFKEDIIWIIDDIAGLNLKNNSFDVILNILSPANYKEFNRVLKQSGIVIKVIPGNKYLCELREFLPNNDGEFLYENSDTLEHAKNRMSIIKQMHLEYTVPVNSEDMDTFIEMTPMTFGKTTSLKGKKINELTIDLIVLVGGV